MKGFLFFGLFLSLVLVYGRELGDMPYLALLATIPLVVMGAGIRLLLKRVWTHRFDFSINYFGPLDRLLSNSLAWLWFLIIISWIIGVCLGLINGVDSKLVFRNFFALTLYAIVPVLILVRPTPQSLIKTVFLSGIVQMCFALTALSGAVLTGKSVFVIEDSISDGRVFYNTGMIAVFPLFAVSIAYHFLPKSSMSVYGDKFFLGLWRNPLFAVLTAIALVVPSMSKGFILSTATLFSAIMVISAIFFSHLSNVRVKLLVLCVLSGIVLIMLPAGFYETVLYSFSDQEASNAVRAEQFHILISELTIFGNGLGSSLKSGYARDATGYGFELTYLNIIHKIGIFSVFLFFSYIVVVTIALRRITKRIYMFESVFVFGSMGYLIVGAGNPILLSAPSVVLHCIAMYVLLHPYMISTWRLVRAITLRKPLGVTHDLRQL